MNLKIIGVYGKNFIAAANSYYKHQTLLDKVEDLSKAVDIDVILVSSGLNC